MLGWAGMKFKNFKTKIANKNYITHRPVYTTNTSLHLSVWSEQKYILIIVIVDQCTASKEEPVFPFMEETTEHLFWNFIEE